MIAAEELLKPISEELPCGEDLSNDASLQELETMARRNPLGTLAGAVAIGVLIGIMGRRS